LFIIKNINLFLGRKFFCWR